jgi:protoheme ferro-lyase
MEYAKTKDMLHVMQTLGHKDIRNTMLYTQFSSFESDEYNHAVARTLEEENKLIDAS